MAEEGAAPVPDDGAAPLAEGGVDLEGDVAASQEEGGAAPPTEPEPPLLQEGEASGATEDPTSAAEEAAALTEEGQGVSAAGAGEDVAGSLPDDSAAPMPQEGASASPYAKYATTEVDSWMGAAIADRTADVRKQVDPNGEVRSEEEMRVVTIELRIERLLKENAQLCAELTDVGQKLDKSRLTEEELQVNARGASSMFSRQKLVAENLYKSVQHQTRSELLKLTESANQIGELRCVQTQLEAVHRQLDFAVTLQSQALTQCENKIAGRTRRTRKLELGMYRIISQAQCYPSLERCVASLVSKSGPLVHNVLSREAQRQALELASREDAANQALDLAARGDAAAQNAAANWEVAAAA
jgi:hypothetical protein